VATRGAIVRIDEDGTFFGVRHQRYSMPEALGKTLWNLYHEHYKGNLSGMLKFLIDEHPAGWSTMVGANFALPSGYRAEDGTIGPQCYCHGRLSAGAFPVTVKTIFDQGMSWIYAFDEAKNKMWIVFNDLKSKVIDSGFEIDLNGDEPDWLGVRCGKKFERCEHLAADHFPELVNTPSGRLRAAVYLNQEPLTVVDVMAVISEGIRFELSGRTKQGNEVIHAFCTAKGSKTEKDITIAHADPSMPGGFRPSERVIWVFPATKKDKGEESITDYGSFLMQHRNATTKKKKSAWGSAGSEAINMNELLIRVGERRFAVAGEE
jgi:hypothetical protein